MADKLRVDLEVGRADEATAKVAKFTGELKKGEAAGNAFAVNFEKQLAATERASRSLAFDLKNLSAQSIKTNGVDGFSKAVQRTEGEVRKAIARLRELDAQAGRTRDPALLKNIQAEAIKTGADIDRLRAKMERVSASRAARPQKMDLAGLAGAAAGFGIPGAADAAQALDLAKQAGLAISIAGAATAAGVAAAGLVAIKVSKDIRAEAEKRLKVEEGIAIAVNKQILGNKQALEDFAKLRTEKEFDRQFQEDLQKQSIEQLESRRKLAEQILALSPQGSGADQNRQIILGVDAEAATRAKKAAADQDAAFNSRNERFKRSQIQAAEFEKKQAEAFAASVKSGRDRVEELQKTAGGLFADLFAKRGASNPFVSVFSEAEAAITRARKETAGLTDDLRAQALQLTENQNANALFSARLDNSLRAGDLTADARRFRTAGRSVAEQARADLFATQAMEKFRRETAEGLFRNPDNLNIFRSGTSAKTGLELFNFQRQQEQAGGLFRNPEFDDEIRRRIAREADARDEVSASERLQKQLDIVRDANPTNDFQRAEIDRKIIALTQGLNPAELSDSQRNAAAGAREREAGRLIGAEAEAKKDRAEALTLQKSIDKNIAALLEKANTEGLQGIIRIINDAEDNAAVELGKRPTPKDSKKTTEP